MSAGRDTMVTKKFFYSSAAVVGLAVLLAAWPATRPYAQQSPSVAVQIDSDDIGGVVTSKNGPEAGVWVIAETAELGTRPTEARLVTRCLCRRRSPPPGEGAPERGIQGDVWQLRYDRVVAARREQSPRRRTRIQYWIPGVERRESPCRCPGAIQVEMLTSTAGCRHPVADDGVAAQW